MDCAAKFFDAIPEPAQLFLGNAVMLRIARLHIRFLELLEVLAIDFQFARPSIDQPHIDALGLGAQKSEIVDRSEEHTSELQSLMRISYAVICLKKKKHTINTTEHI